MNAYIVQSPDGPFVKVDQALPIPEPHQVLVRIQASGVNPLDTKIRAAKAAHARQPLPAVLGLDMAGTVIEVGSAVTRFKSGDEVYGMVGGVGGNQGTLADFIAADEDLLALKPENLSMREAAALPLITITAWEGLVDRARVSPGQTVLIHAGAGGVGHIAVQIARAFDAQVFATVSPSKAHIVEAYGATPIDYTALTPAEYIEKYSAGQGFDIVYDTVGGPTLDASFLATRLYTGHAVSCLGWGSHSLAPLSFRGATYSGVFTLLPLISGKGRSNHGEILARATALANAGKLKPLLNDRHFNSTQIAEAHALVETGALGKVVIDL